MTINRMYKNKLLGYRELNAKFAYGCIQRTIFTDPQIFGNLH